MEEPEQKYDPMKYGKELGIPGLMGGPGMVYATSISPIAEYCDKMGLENPYK